MGIEAPENYHHVHDKMLSEIYAVLLEMRNRIERLEMAMVEQARRQKQLENDGR